LESARERSFRRARVLNDVGPDSLAGVMRPNLGGRGRLRVGKKNVGGKVKGRGRDESPSVCGRDRHRFRPGKTRNDVGSKWRHWAGQIQRMSFGRGGRSARRDTKRCMAARIAVRKRIASGIWENVGAMRFIRSEKKFDEILGDVERLNRADAVGAGP